MKLRRGPLLHCRTNRPCACPRAAEKLPQPFQGSKAPPEAPRAAAARPGPLSVPGAPPLFHAHTTAAAAGGWGERQGCILGWGMGAHTAAGSVSHSLGKHAGQGQGWAGGARRGNPAGRPAYTCCSPHAPGPPRQRAGLASAGRALAGAGTTVIGRGRGAAGWSWAAGPRRFHFALRRLPVLNSPDSSVPCHRRRRQVLAAAGRVLPTAVSIASGCSVRPTPVTTALAPSPGPRPPNV